MRPTRTDDTIGPVTRALTVLEALNRRPCTSLHVLNSETGLPKATLVRLLNALRAAGYAEQVSSALGYRVTARVVELAAGYRFRDRVVDAAMPAMQRFTHQHRWPLYLATLEGGAIQVRYSTIADSPLSTEPAAFNRSFPILSSALGRVYLAFCPDAERSMILRALATSRRAENRPARDRRRLLVALREIRQQGYAITPPNRSRYLGLAVPVMHDDDVLACLSLRFLRRALSLTEAVDRYLDDLRHTARSIGQAIDAPPPLTRTAAVRDGAAGRRRTASTAGAATPSNAVPAA
ncbi:MAG TPA: IclR family transcriptional regulator C-terminal domain-containing protein, partial [Vineibacter sp.]|nr:IclR family transcriptional regulator C-terminal domain-containing protein [Vineibacter sp.]